MACGTYYYGFINRFSEGEKDERYSLVEKISIDKENSIWTIEEHDGSRWNSYPYRISKISPEKGILQTRLLSRDVMLKMYKEKE